MQLLLGAGGGAKISGPLVDPGKPGEIRGSPGWKLTHKNRLDNLSLEYNSPMLSLAVQAPQQLKGAGLALAAILLIVLVGIVVILLLGVTWRRYNQRINKSQSTPNKTDHTDLWQAAADRLENHDQPGHPEDPDEPDEPPGHPGSPGNHP